MKKIPNFALALLCSFLISACDFEVEQPDPVRLNGADEFPAEPEQLQNEYDFVWQVQSRTEQGNPLPNDPLGELYRGRMERQYEATTTTSELLSTQYRVTDRHRVTDGQDFTRSFHYGFGDTEQDLLWYSEGGQRIAGDAGARLLRQQIAVGDRFEIQFDYPGIVTTWPTYAEVEVLHTEMLETRLIDIETYVVRIRGNNEDNQRYDTDTDSYRFQKTLWVSPKAGIVRERWVVREQLEHASHSVYTVREYDLRSRPR
ncbi:MAG: hypothetical protein LAT62_00105 [Natronospirillum sp.]|uniref:hypothetical protein n=1 Tax=Natronospirillum sp. TaxID=2812955 RepID=UPI0025DAE89B|nr:hypothetical protein [Natronospirillum sp.]MCH8550302.1 hypothetical protein [Natronospirillum sp.]